MAETFRWMVWSNRTRHSTAAVLGSVEAGPRHCRCPPRHTTTARGVRLLLAPLVTGMWIAGHLDAQRVDRGVRATEQCPQVRPAEREIHSLLRPADDADAPAVRRQVIN